MTEVSLAYSVATSKGWSLELAGTDFGDIMGQFAANRFL
jgi:hypothetical protein